jgi:hypothetical protein
MTGQRAVERVRIDAFVKIAGEISGGEAQELVFRTRDLSEQGLFLYTAVAQAYPIKVGTTLDLDLQAGETQVRCKVVVVRVVAPGSDESASFPTGFGVKIVELSDEARTEIQRLIRRATTES